MVSVRRFHDRIVVGVDGSAASLRAVLWAAAEARIRRGDLIITHVQPAVPVVGSTRSGAGVDRHRLLTLSATAASTRQPGVAVGTLLLTGDISDQLIELSRSAAVLVVGLDRSVSRASHGATGPVEDRVIAHAHCPVVIVSDQQPAEAAAFDRVVVGWTADQDATHLLSSAATEAAVRSAALEVLTCRSDGSSRRDEPDQGPGDAAALARAVEAIQQSHSQLQVIVNSSPPPLSLELERESAHSDLLVVGCTKSDDRWSIRTGPLASEMIRRSNCPVMLVGSRVHQRDTSSCPAA